MTFISDDKNIENKLDFGSQYQKLTQFLKTTDRDEVHIYSNVQWEEYENILLELGDSSWCKVSYLDGLLKIISPGINHERIKELTGMLIVSYCDVKDIEYFPCGSTTLKNKSTKSGQEPDVSYAININKEIPDIAVEVNHTSGSIDDLEIYKRLQIPEIWMWDKSNNLSIYILNNTEYERSNNSKFLKDLDSNIVHKYVLKMKQESPRIVKKEFIKEIGF